MQAAAVFAVMAAHLLGMPCREHRCLRAIFLFSRCTAARTVPRRLLPSVGLLQHLTLSPATRAARLLALRCASRQTVAPPSSSITHAACLSSYNTGMPSRHCSHFPYRCARHVAVILGFFCQRLPPFAPLPLFSPRALPFQHDAISASPQRLPCLHTTTTVPPPHYTFHRTTTALCYFYLLSTTAFSPAPAPTAFLLTTALLDSCTHTFCVSPLHFAFCTLFFSLHLFSELLRSRCDVTVVERCYTPDFRLPHCCCPSRFRVIYPVRSGFALDMVTYVFAAF